MDLPLPSLARTQPTGRWAWLPAGAWLRDYQRGWLRADVVAGVTLAAYLLPAGLGDASLANLPPEAGLYACLFSGLVFWLFCSSRHTAITVTSAISLLIGASLGGLAGGDPSASASWRPAPPSSWRPSLPVWLVARARSSRSSPNR